jgi:hypothetical protein
VGTVPVRAQGVRGIKWLIVGASALVYVLINVFWFTNILPPLPVALARSGIYTDVKHVGDNYIGTGELAAVVPGAVHAGRARGGRPAALCLHGRVRASDALHAHHA